MANLVIFSKSTWGDDWSDSGYEKFHNWIQKNDGKRYATLPDCFSVYNRQKSGKRATLHKPTVHAIELFGSVLSGQQGPFNQRTAIGIQYDEKGQPQYYCCEVSEDDKVIYGAYNVKSGKFRMGVKDGDVYKSLPAIGSGRTKKEDGYSLMLLIVVQSYMTNKEFRETIERYFGISASKNPLDDPGKVEDMFVMCDNIYRRCAYDQAPADKVALSIAESGNVTALKAEKIPEFSPEEKMLLSSDFEVLNGKGPVGKRIKRPETMSELKAAYSFGIQPDMLYADRVPVMPENYMPSKALCEMAEMAKLAGMRKFMLRGEAGTGKTTDAMALAQVLDVPYFRFTCSEKTDEMDLVCAMIPNTGSQNKYKIPENPIDMSDFKMDPGYIMEQFTGEYDEEMDKEKALSILFDVITEGINKDSGFKMVESTIIKGAQVPSVVEIQEPACIAKQATLVRLNSLLDDGASITLIDGREVHLNPNTVFVLTTNTDYAGCRKMNESVLSRMDEIIDCDTPTADVLTKRAMKKFGISSDSDQESVYSMAETIIAIQDYCREQMISGGVCCVREFENWIRRYQVRKDQTLAACCRYTVVSKISPDKEIQDEVMNAVVYPKIGE